MGVGEIIPMPTSSGEEFFGFYRKDETDDRYLACLICSENEQYAGRLRPTFKPAGFFRKARGLFRFTRWGIVHFPCLMKTADK